MPEPLTPQHNEPIANLQAQLAALQQANIALQSQLQACEQAQSKRQADAPNAALESRLLVATAMAVNALQSFDNFDVAVKTVLQAIGESLEADRVGVVKNFAPSPNAVAVGWRVLYEWTSPQAISQLNHPALSAGTWEGIEHWYERLSQGQSLSYLLEELPEPFRSGQAALGVKALHVVPIFVAGEYWGATAFDDCQVAKHRSTAELTALKITAACLGTAIQCDRAQQALLAAERERAAIAREQAQATQARATELAKANRALKQAVNVLATETDLNHFIGHVLRLAAEQFEAPLAEYWQVTNPNLGSIVGWWGRNQMHGFGQDHEHPALETGVQVPPYMLEDRQFSDRRHHLVAPFDHSVAPAEGAFTSDPAAWYASFGVSWQLNLPLVVGETCFGVLNFWQPSDRPFTEQQIELGYALAQQVTLAIRLSQLAEESKQAAIAREQEQAAQARAAELAKANAVLARTSSRLAEQPNLSAFLSHLMFEAMAQVGADGGHLTLYDKQRDVIATSVLIEDGKVVQAPFFPPEMPVAEVGFMQFIRETRKLRYFDLEANFEQDAPLLWQDVGEHHQRQKHVVGIAIPLFVGDEFLGHFGLAFKTKPTLTEQGTELLQALAHQAALAIQLTQLAEEAKQAAILEERNRMAREIHDTIAQGLSGIVIQLQAAAAIPDAIAQQEHLTQARQLAELSLIEARRSVQALRPQPLDTASLIDALTTLAHQLTRNAQVKAIVHMCGVPYALLPEVENQLFRIAQESITNVLKHSQASQLHLTLVYQPLQVQLTVQDDGQGFDPDRISSSSYGLLGMQERAQAIGGVLTFTSQPGQGTTIAVLLPVAASVEESR